MLNSYLHFKSAQKQRQYPKITSCPLVMLITVQINLRGHCCSTQSLLSPKILKLHLFYETEMLQFRLVKFQAQKYLSSFFKLNFEITARVPLLSWFKESEGRIVPMTE